MKKSDLKLLKETFPAASFSLDGDVILVTNNSLLEGHTNACIETSIRSEHPNIEFKFNDSKPINLV